jgi:2-polyprenyl-3-methyl-5-hydroxy-6-metoxy-1,4-benzoquinol methylase
MNGILTNSSEAKLNSSYYNKFWKKYKLNNEDIIRSEFIKRNLKKLKLKKNVEILDLGCGYGWMSTFVSKFGIYTGIDFSTDAIKFAKKEFGSNGNFVLADETSIRLGLPDDKKFDIIICSEVIEHVVDHNSFIDQITMFIKPNGFLILTTPNGLCWEKFSKMHERESMQPVENWLTPNNLENLFLKHNFKILIHEGRILFPALRNKYISYISRLVDNVTHALHIERLYMRNLRQHSLYLMLVMQKQKTNE